jgi:hypothetical protein
MATNPFNVKTFIAALLTCANVRIVSRISPFILYRRSQLFRAVSVGAANELPSDLLPKRFIPEIPKKVDAHCWRVSAFVLATKLRQTAVSTLQDPGTS